MRILILAGLMCGMLGCARSTRSLAPVKGFDAQRYAGRWYEIARFPHWFERGLVAVTADYTLQPNGRIRVENRGYNPAKKEWTSARARAYLKGSADVGLLKVSFFWPFYGTYKILVLDKDYAYAVVTSDTYDYFWILARTPTLDAKTVDALVKSAAAMGFETDLDHRVVEARRALTVGQVKSAMVAGHAVGTAFDVSERFSEVGRDGMWRHGGRIVGGHAITLYGYDDGIPAGPGYGPGSLLALNSWGDDWGERLRGNEALGGGFRVPYAVFNDPSGPFWDGIVVEVLDREAGA